MRWILLTLLFSLVRSQCNLGQYSFNGACTDCPSGQFMNKTDHVYVIPCSTLYYKTTPGSYSNENSVEIKDNSGSRIFEIDPFSTSVECKVITNTQFCPGIVYDVILMDSWGDGWNGGATFGLFTDAQCSDSNKLQEYTLSDTGYKKETFELTGAPSSSSVCYTCDKCQPGTYETDACISTTNTQCQECQGGQYQNQEDQLQCNDCSTGQYSLAGATVHFVCRGHISRYRGYDILKPCPTVNIKIKADKHLVKHVRSMKRRQKTKPLVLFNVVKDAITKMEPVPIAKQAFIVISQPLSPPKQQIRIVTISGLNYMTIQRSMTIQVQLIVFVF